MAEFKTVISEWNRMCNYVDGCTSCPIRKTNGNIAEGCSVWAKYHPEEMERITMQWSSEHPFVTNGMKFREVFGIDLEEKYLVTEHAKEWACQEYKGERDNG